jgi:sensor histidine kinase regulating citrate/malate metabolism
MKEMRLRKRMFMLVSFVGVLLVLLAAWVAFSATSAQSEDRNQQLLEEGRQTFRYLWR